LIAERILISQEGLCFTKLVRWAGRVAGMRQMRNAYNTLVGGSEGKRPHGIPRRRREDNIRIDIREIGWEIVDWMHLAQDRDQ